MGLWGLFSVLFFLCLISVMFWYPIRRGCYLVCWFFSQDFCTTYQRPASWTVVVQDGGTLIIVFAQRVIQRGQGVANSFSAWHLQWWSCRKPRAAPPACSLLVLSGSGIAGLSSLLRVILNKVFFYSILFYWYIYKILTTPVSATLQLSFLLRLTISDL